MQSVLISYSSCYFSSPVWWLVCAISLFRLFAWRYGAALRRNNTKRKDEITKKKKKNARRKDEKLEFKMALFRMAFFRLFALVFLHFAWRISLFRLFAWRYLSFRYFAWRFSLFRLFAWRYFVLAPRHNARRKDEKTK